MKIMVVEPALERRAELVDAICELPGVEVRAAAPSFLDARHVFASELIDAIVIGDVPQMEHTYLMGLARSQSCSVVLARAAHALWLPSSHASAAATGAELARVIGEIVAKRGRADAPRTTQRAEPLTFERYSQRSDPRVPRRPRGLTAGGGQALVLADWLPRAIATLRTSVPECIEIKALVSGDLPAVQCIPSVLEQLVRELVLQSCKALPWGGTIWITAEPNGPDHVRLDVVENGRGGIRDLTLRASTPACS